LANYKIDLILRVKTILFLIVFLCSVMANVFYTKKHAHADTKNQPRYAMMKTAHLTWLSPFSHREKNLPLPRISVPKIKFSGIVFILTFLGSTSLIALTKLSKPVNLNCNNLQNICITHCVLRL